MTVERQQPLLIVEDDLALQKQIKWSLDRYEAVVAIDHPVSVVAGFFEGANIHFTDETVIFDN